MTSAHIASTATILSVVLFLGAFTLPGMILSVLIGAPGSMLAGLFVKTSGPNAMGLGMAVGIVTPIGIPISVWIGHALFKENSVYTVLSMIAGTTLWSMLATIIIATRF